MKSSTVIAATWDQLPGRELCARAAEVLHRHYPDHPWSIVANTEGGVLDIFHLRLSHEWGYRLKLSDIQFRWTAFNREVMRAGGDLLERYAVPRKGYDRFGMGDLSKGLNGLPKPVGGASEDANKRRKLH